MSAGVLDFCDAGWMRVISGRSFDILVKAIVVLTLLGCRVGAQWRRKRTFLGMFARADAWA